MQTFDSDGVPIAYLDVAPAEGAAEPILLIHGFASNHMVNWVNTSWVRSLTGAGRRVIALDNRGHGRSGKLYEPEAYGSDLMAEDARRLLDHLGIARADVMGYSMGARITAFLALGHPDRVRSAVLGGLGIHLVEGRGLPAGISDAMEAPSRDAVADPTARMFRGLRRIDRQRPAGARRLHARLAPDPVAGGSGADRGAVLVAVGHTDTVAGSGRRSPP